jgi:hypothetical protein
MTRDEFLEALLSAPDIEARLFLIGENSEHVQTSTVYVLKERADQSERDDARKALQIGQIAEEVAEHLADDEARAVALWIQANAQDLLAELESAPVLRSFCPALRQPGNRWNPHVPAWVTWKLSQN